MEKLNWVVFNRSTRQKIDSQTGKLGEKKNGHAMHKTLIRDISEHSARVDFTTYLDNEVSSGGAHVFFIESGTGHLYAYFDFIFPLSFLSVSLSILFLSLSLFFSTHVHDDV